MMLMLTVVQPSLLRRYILYPDGKETAADYGEWWYVYI